jgi:hypothetical protein
MRTIHILILTTLGVFAIFILSLVDRNREYTDIRSKVIMATGYDISYPEKWKGVCK